MDEMIGRPGTGELHLAAVHRGAGGDKFILVALYALAIDQMSDIQHHFSVVDQPTAHFFVEREEEPVHLEADCTSPRLAFTRPRSILAQVAQIRAAYSLGSQMILDLPAAAVVDKDLEVHLGLAAELVDVAEKLPLVGADRLTQHLVVSEYGAEPERKHGGVLKTVGDDPCVIDSGLLVEAFLRVVLAHNDGKITGGIKEDLIAANTKD